MTKKMIVQECPTPRDFYEDCTVSVTSWLRGNDGRGSAAGWQKRWGRFMAACSAVSEVIGCCPVLRGEPSVAYDAPEDAYYFIFQMDQKGTTYVVSERGVELERGG